MSTRRFLRRAWRLAVPYWNAEERWRARALLGAIVGLNLASVYVLVLLNSWNRLFYNALEQKDAAAFSQQLLRFCGLAACFIVVAVYRLYLTQVLEMRWRRWLSEVFLTAWLGDRAYFALELVQRGTDNPDQRIAEDLRNFASGTLSLAMGLLNAGVTLVSFVGILWAISGPLAFTLAGTPVMIPGYMVWAAVIYSLVGTLIAHRIGRPLVALNFEQQRFEADFRFSLVRLRENAEGVALYAGEETERRGLSGRFGRILDNWWRLIHAQKRLTWFTVGYGQAANVFPILVAAPRYFSGAIQLGGLMQIASAFGRVQDALSWFVDSYSRLAEWKASVDRLVTFEDSLAAAVRAAQREDAIRTVSGATDEIALDGVNIALPTGQLLAGDVRVVLRRGEKVLLSGPSGSGKSTIFRTVAGIWPFGSGTVRRPEGTRVLFLPQKPYVPIAPLRDAVAYPSGGATFTDEAIADALHACSLGALVGRLDEVQHWSQCLSSGEQQRLAFARALLHAPEWLFLDEATSALDADSERRVYEAVVSRLSGTTIVSIAHGPALASLHERRLIVTPGVASVEATVVELPLGELLASGQARARPPAGLPRK